MTAVLCLILCLSSCGKSEPYDGRFGSAGYINSKTLIVSVFADDANTSWKKESRSFKEKLLETMIKATDHLEKETSRYSKGCEFVCDWRDNPDLLYTASFDRDMTEPTGKKYKYQYRYIEKNIDTEALKEKYGCENVIYAFIYNTDYSSTGSCDAFSSSLFERPEAFQPEIINLVARAHFLDNNEKYELYPQKVAHEILHTFGAPDMYEENEMITKDYLRYMYSEYEKNGEYREIMYVAPRDLNDIHELTDLDAYYLGLRKSSDEVEKYGLGKSIYENENKQ